ncbi:MAG: VOC family protein [Balneola sp.]|nr:MAG: VOC family protein [Balneola sp.]
MEKVIAGIQQIGIGNTDVEKTTEWYRKYFGMDIKVFDDAATANLMLPYTGGKPHDRRAILTLSMRGGGGFEIWQYTSRTPQPCSFDIMIGDLGINAAKIKSINVEETYEQFNMAGLKVITSLKENPAGDLHFYVEDLHGNIFEVVKGLGWFKKREQKTTGGVSGALIGSTDIEKSRTLYSDILGYDEVVYDESEKFEDLQGLPGGDQTYRRILLRHSSPRQGGFSKLFGPTEIELIQSLDEKRTPSLIFEDRYWGDLGFIHLCFDVQGMDALKEECEQAGFPFTVDSADSFDMGEAAGRFTYIEDPDGTLIEFVETHKVPIAKKLGLFVDMTKRDPKKDLPKWMLSALSLSRMKD